MTPQAEAMLDALNQNQKQLAVMIKDVSSHIFDGPKEMVEVCQFIIARYGDEAKAQQQTESPEDSFSA